MRKLIIPLGILLFAGCYNDKEDVLYPGGQVCDTTTMSFAIHIQPIVNQNCATANCHDAVTKSFGYDLSNFNGVVSAVNSGRLLGAIKHETGFQPMPKGLPELGDCEISKISGWISQGMKQ
jgi:hypothetical protein